MFEVEYEYGDYEGNITKVKTTMNEISLKMLEQSLQKYPHYSLTYREIGETNINGINPWQIDEDYPLEVGNGNDYSLDIGNNNDYPLTVGENVVPLTIGEGIVSLTIGENVSPLIIDLKMMKDMKRKRKTK